MSPTRNTPRCSASRDVPPLPPHISLKNAKAFMSTLRKGDPNELGIIKQSVKEFVEELLPHGR